MSDILTERKVLRINANWFRLGWCSAQDALIAMMSEGKDGSPPALAADITYNYNEFGKPITDENAGIIAYNWEDWINLKPREGDLDRCVHTSKRIIRIPTVLICAKYFHIPMKEQRPTPSSIRLRDGNRCAYTNVPLTNKTFSLDHVIPRSKGGKDSWENLVSCHKDVNSKKGNKSNKEAGLVLLKKPVAPKSIPISALVTGNYHPDHQWF